MEYDLFFGLVSYFLLFLGISLGILYGFPFKGKRRATVYKFHQTCTNLAFGLAIVHAMILIIDTYMPFTWTELLIPFSAKNSPVLNGIGSIALYGMLILIFTSDIRNKLKKKVWRTIHILAYPTFVLAFIHGFFIGTDSFIPVIKDMYFITFIVPLILLLIRVVMRTNEKPEPKRMTSRSQRYDIKKGI